MRLGETEDTGVSLQSALILVATSQHYLLDREKGERGIVEDQVQNNKLNDYTQKKIFRMKETHRL